MRYLSIIATLLFAVVVLLLASSCDTYQGQYQSGTYQSIAYQDAIDNGIPPDKFVKQIQVESGFNQYAVSPMGAIGIAQIMPDTASGWGVDPRDPSASLSAAAKAMSSYQNQYGDYSKALVCYNAGCTALLRAENGCSYYYWCLLPETRHYIDMIMT